MTRKTKLWIITVFILVVTVGSIWVFSIISTGLPSLEELENPRPALATKVYSADGVVIDKFFE